MDIIRLSILDEVEKKSAKTWTCFENEIEKYRNLYFKTSRELQVLKSDYDRLIHEKKASLEEMKKSHEEELQMFETRIISLQSSLDAVSDPERLRTLTRENSEFQLKVVDLIAELDQIRGEKEHILANSSQQERLHQRRLLDETAMAKQMAVERDCSKSRVI